MRQRLGRMWHFGSWAVTILLVVLWVVWLRPTSLGGDATYVVIRGDSMQPAYANGDLVILRNGSSYGVGDAVAYRVPDGETGAGTLVLHRIIGGDPASGFVMKGDNNTGQDPWLPRPEDIVGAAGFHVPMLGRLTAFVRQPVILGGLGAALAVTWVIARAPAPRRALDRPLSRRPAAALSRRRSA